MTQAYICRLCSNICIESERLCDTNGLYTEIYEITIRFFSPTLLNLDHGGAVLCLECWQHISEFHNFQQTILLVQAKLLKNAEQARDVVQAQAGIRSQDSHIRPIHTAALEVEDESVPLSEANVRDINHSIVTECALEFEELADSLKENEVNVPADVISLGDSSEDEDNVASNDETDSFEDEFEEPVGVFIGGEFNEVVDNSKIQNDNTSVPSATTNRSKSMQSRKSNQQLEEAISKWKPTLKCDICREPCSNFTLLQTHFREKHPNDKCFVICCNRKFTNRYYIEQHIRVHLDPNIFTCSICNKRLTSKSILVRHMYCVHGINTSFQRKKCTFKHKCTICEKTFKAPGALLKHFTAHTGEPLQNCSYCPETFKYRSSLCHHLTNAHPEHVKKRKQTGDISACSQSI